MKMHKGRLTERQRLFCEHYVGAGKHNAALSARLAGYASGSSHVTGCQLLNKPKIAATVRGLEEAVAHQMGVSRQVVITQLVGAADLARELREPASMISAYRNVAQICGYYRQEEVKDANLTKVRSGVQANFAAMADAELVALIEQGNAATH